LALTDKGIVVDRNVCDTCGICAKVCLTSTLEVLGEKYTVDEVAGIVLRDKVFYEKSNGGMTLSGGEPAMQPLFSVALMKAVKQEGVHVALDTCCGGPAIAVNIELSMNIQNDNIKDAMDNRAEAMIMICPMCDYVMRGQTSKAGLPKIFITDLCRMALGEVSWPVS
jgi:ferredoxin